MSLFELNTQEKIERLQRALAWSHEIGLTSDHILALTWAARKHLEYLIQRKKKPPPEYIIINDKYPYVRHKSLAATLREAKRLAEKMGGNFTVLKVKRDIEPKTRTACGEKESVG